MVLFFLVHGHQKSDLLRVLGIKFGSSSASPYRAFDLVVLINLPTAYAEDQYEYGAGGARYISRHLSVCEQERSSLPMGPRDINNWAEIRLQAISPPSKYIIFLLY